ncbi:hypothetical protein MUN84_05180 [Hymenobacter sp. 5516J-16]|uniref:DUF6565 domain-containing protein n=1 Tax=Hymenobacter sp. 5516J-16 TaxID=2932253 RepID=UPI001FD303AD|nr:DUF6565 domain-containing protein [Hymenobacter sp. 5516J-16]UOQ78015.1 hypothetical protein MUN84_05180 [Hymenobacter sp. 5516J-16]
MFKQHINAAVLAGLLLASSATTFTSCSSKDKKEVSEQGQRAYDNLQAYVSEAETNPTTTVPDTFAARLAAAQQYNAEYDTTQQAEIQRLQERYSRAQSGSSASASATASTDTTGAMMTTESATTTSVAATSTPANEAPAKLYKASNPATAMTAANARQTYEAFIQRVKANEDKYEIGDWRVINAEWRAMDKKYDQIKDEVSTKDKAEISKEKLKYAAFKSYDKTESRVSQGGDVVTGDLDEAKAKGGA